MKRKSKSLILAFYPEAQQASEALRLLRKKRFFRSASISVSGKNRRHIAGRAHILTVLLISAAVLIAIPAMMQEYSWTSVIGIAAAVFVAGLVSGPRLGLSLDGKILREYAPRVFPGETLILVQCSNTGMLRVTDILQNGGSGKPVLFAIRPHLQEPMHGKHRDRGLMPMEQLRQHAVSLAVSHIPAPPEKSRNSILQLLAELEMLIKNVSRDLAEAVELNQSVTPSTEWLLDNAYIIQNHIQDIRRNLPKRFYEFLPSIADVPEGTCLRIQQLAFELVNETDGNISTEAIHNFLGAYQDHRPLNIAELWIFPLMLRYALVDDLAYQALRVSERQHERELADFCANRLLSAARRCPQHCRINPRSIWSRRWRIL